MNLYAIVLSVIVVTLLTVSLTRLGKVKTKADYLVAGRSLPAFVLVFTLLSSWIGSGSLLGGAENAYKHGFAALWQGGGGWAGLLLIYFIARVQESSRSSPFPICWRLDITRRRGC
jgi:SSS family solute:Na+ symporter